MKPSEFKKEKQTTIRVNLTVEAILKEKGFSSIQKFFNEMVNSNISLKEFLEKDAKMEGGE
jgi:hypothetical protein